MNDEVPSISSQFSIEVIPELVLRELFKLIDSVISKGQEDQRKQSFLEKKDSINIAPINESFYEVIDRFTNFTRIFLTSQNF